MLKFFLPVLLALVLFSAPAAASCTSPDGAESQTRYDFTAHKQYYCNGTNWVESGAPVGAMTNNKWCRGTGTQIVCDQNAPTGSADNLGNHTAAANLAMGNYKISGLGAPTATTDATTKTYVDTAVNARVGKAGDTMTGALSLSGTPTANNHAATKEYVDTVASAAGGGAAATCAIICNGTCPAAPSGWTLAQSTGESGHNGGAGRCGAGAGTSWDRVERLCCYFKS